MSRGSGKKNRVVETKINAWTMVRDVLIRSIDKGQLPQATLALILVSVVLKMPEDSVGQLARDVFQTLVDWTLGGWVLAGVLAVSWFSHAKWQRGLWSMEMKRITDERTRYQEDALKLKLRSSDK